MPTTRETVLAALHARLQPLAVLSLRDEVLPERIPAAGLIILRDGHLMDSPLRAGVDTVASLLRPRPRLVHDTAHDEANLPKSA